MIAAEALERIRAEPRFGTFSDVAKAILAVAWVDGRPLRVRSEPADLETLVVAEYLCRRDELRAGAALERARGRETTTTELQHAVRFAASRHVPDHLVLRSACLASPASATSTERRPPISHAGCSRSPPTRPARPWA